VPFGSITRFTYMDQGSSTISIRGIQYSSWCTVMLGCSMTATNLPPFIVFKGSENRKGTIARELLLKTAYLDDVDLTVQENAWFDDQVMLQWITTAWKPHHASKLEEETIILLDEFKVHLTATVKEDFIDCNTSVGYIPTGYTSNLQVMDFSFNKQFKDYLRRELEAWMVRSPTEIQMKRHYVAWWIDSAWKSITTSIITDTWRQ
jgi:DDE superfamily endonuclease